MYVMRRVWVSLSGIVYSTHRWAVVVLHDEQVSSLKISMTHIICLTENVYSYIHCTFH